MRMDINEKINAFEKIGEVLKETLEEMKERQMEIVFSTRTSPEAIQKRKEALGYVMEQLEYIDRIYRLGF